MSRIMLSLKAMMSRFSNMPTMIFDEIDTGVSGSVADKMGSMICEMGENMQVFAITHLPQVAACGTTHFAVAKSVADGRTSTHIDMLSQEERVEELVRMLGGAGLTSVTKDHARELLSSAH
jgi:DNA repair protein RecN (Recombination protein N)